ncbi:hypothetical protein Hanom_Chr06g00533731 [Helianthus anomalus]
MRRTKVTRSKSKARSANRKSGGLFILEAQGTYIFIYIYIYPIGLLASLSKNIVINKVYI